MKTLITSLLICFIFLFSYGYSESSKINSIESSGTINTYLMPTNLRPGDSVSITYYYMSLDGQQITDDKQISTTVWKVGCIPPKKGYMVIVKYSYLDNRGNFKKGQVSCWNRENIYRGLDRAKFNIMWDSKSHTMWCEVK